MKRSKVHIATTPVDSPARVVYRFFKGQDLNGGYKTDHKWAKRGTQITASNGRASRWAHQPMRRRAGIRVLALLSVLALAIGLIISASGTVATLRIIAWFSIASSAWITYERARKYAHRRQVVAPLAEALAQRLSDSRYVHDPRAWIDVPVDVQDGTTTVYLPVDYSPTDPQEKALARMVSRKVGLLNPTSTFELMGDRPFLALRPAPSPPDRVDFTDPAVAAMVTDAPEGTLFLGLGARGKPCTLNLNTEAPHVGMSMATNAGKSTTGRGCIMQHLHDGGIGLILDPKMDSQLWCRGLPNVRYADTPQEIHEALLWLSGELDRRSAIAKAHADIRGDIDPNLVGPRLMVVAEELNTLETDVSTYWRTIRDAKAGDPIKPVSLTALGRALNMGRARRINCLMIAQELLVQSLGGPAAKANLSTRILGRANTPTWNKLAPECKVSGRYPRWRRSDPRGRVYVVTGDEPTLVQVMFVDEQTAIDYALSGIVATFPREAGREAGPAFPQDEAASQHGDHSETRTPTNAASLPHDVDATGELVTLSDASERLALSLKTLRNARDRDPQFPEPASVERGKPSTYHLIELEKWAITRAYGLGGQQT